MEQNLKPLNCSIGIVEDLVCPNFYLGAKLSVCLLGAKLSVFTILVPNCPVPNNPDTKLSGAKLSYHPFMETTHLKKGLPFS